MIFLLLGNMSSSLVPIIGYLSKLTLEVFLVSLGPRWMIQCAVSKQVLSHGMAVGQLYADTVASGTMSQACCCCICRTAANARPGVVKEMLPKGQCSLQQM